MIVKKGRYECDAGSLKIGNRGCSILIPNGIGDGEYQWAIGTDLKKDTAKEYPDGMDFKMCIQGEELYIYDYDCKAGLPVFGPFSGSFMVYAKDGNIYLERLSLEPNWWGENNPGTWN